MDTDVELLKIYDDENLTDLDTDADGIQFSWSTDLIDGENTITFQVIDLAGNVGDEYTKGYILDTDDPAQKISGIDIDDDDDTGESDTDLITNIAAQTISASLDEILASGEAIYASVDTDVELLKIYDDENLTDLDTDADGIQFSWSTDLIDGENTITFQVIDLAGNVGDEYTKGYILDTDDPAQKISGIDIDDDDDTGESDTDLITNIAAQTISASLDEILASGEAIYASVDTDVELLKIYDDENLTDLDTDADGIQFSWSTDLIDGENTITFQVIDLAGNVGDEYTKGYILDTDDPAQKISGIDIDDDDDTGESDTDLITNIAAQTISASLDEILASGEAIYASVDTDVELLKIYDDENLTDLDTDADGIQFSWSTDLIDGENTITFQVIDLAGNVGDEYTKGYILDTDDPAQKISGIDIDDDDDTGESDTDLITNIAAQTISASLDEILASGEAIYASVDTDVELLKIYDDENLTDLDTDADGIQFSWSTDLIDGENTITFQVIDLAGNVGDEYTKGYILDTDDPAQTISGIDIDDDDDTGESDTDLITNIAAQTISASLDEILASGEAIYASVDTDVELLKIYDDENLTDLDTDADGIQFSWSTDLIDGENTITFQVIDLAGNVGDEYTKGYILDTDDPAQTISGIDIDDADDTGESDTDLITNIAAQTISASLDEVLASGEAIYASVDTDVELLKIYDDENLTDLDTDADGIQFSWATDLIDGENTITFQVIDLAGNVGDEYTKGYILDTDDPAQTINGIDIDDDDDTGESDTDLITNIAAQTISASLDEVLASGEAIYASVDTDVELLKIYDDENLTDLDTDADGIQFSWATDLIDGENTITFQVIDLAGNVGDEYTKGYILDTDDPAQTISGIDIDDDDDTGESDTDLITNIAAQTISASLDEVLASGEAIYASVDADVELLKIYDDENLTDLDTDADGIQFSWATDLIDGENTITFQVIDLAGNVGDEYTKGYILDTDDPAQTISGIDIDDADDTGESDTDLITNIAAQTISASLDEILASGEAIYASVDADVELLKIYDDENLTDLDTDADGIQFSWATDLIDDENTITFQVIDLAGNVGDEYTKGYILDTDDPAQTISGIDIDDDDDTGESDTDLITNIAAQTISASLDEVLASGEAIYASVDTDVELLKIYDDENLTDLDTDADGIQFSWSTDLIDGENTITFQVIDLAGNVGDEYTKGYILDTDDPAQKISGIDIDDADDTGESDTDLITNIASQTISASLDEVLASGEAIYASVDTDVELLKIYDDENLTDLDTDADGIQFSWSTDLIDGENTITFQVIDLAGNVGDEYTKGYILDTDDPAQTISGIDIDDADDTGESDTDLITNIAAQTISASLDEILASGEAIYASVDTDVELLKIYDDENLTDLDTDADGIQFSWSTDLIDGENTITFQVIDLAMLAGNVKRR